MNTYRLENGAKYQAKIVHVPFFAGAGTIKDKLTEGGFVDLYVWKDGGDWYAQGVFSGETDDYELDSHIDAASIVKL